jgi:AcrR family transcriptional regulator
MTTMTDHEQRKPGRPRSAQAHQAILGATLEVLAEDGYEAMSIEAVAARAGVGKTTIYRRWASKEELVIDAIRSVHADVPIIDTGHLRDDLISLLHNGYQVIRKRPLLGKLALKVVGEYLTQPETFQCVLSQYLVPRFQQVFHLIEQAQARGEIRENVDPLFVFGLLMGPLLCRSIFTSVLASVPPPADFVEQIVDTVLQGIAPE